LIAGRLACSGFVFFARFDDVNFPLVAHRLYPPDEAAGPAFLYRRFSGAESAGMHVNLDSRSFSAMWTFHGKSPCTGYGWKSVSGISLLIRISVARVSAILLAPL
jgi:hypothetical protein